jgi:DNA-binding transcriptional LysR family regulator
MEFKKIKYVLTVAEVQSISKAANILCMTQPSLSHSISKIENELGIKLFDRTTTPISLTYAGEKFVKTAKEILNLNDKLIKEFSDISNMVKGRIKIGVPYVRGSFILPYVLPRFLEKYPNIELGLMEGNTHELEQFLLNGEVDIVFTVNPSENEKIRREVIGREKVKLACKKGYLPSEYIRKGTKNLVNFQKLKDVNFILTKKGHRIRDLVEDLFNKNGFTPKILLETSNSSTAYRLATTGLGVCFAWEVIIHSTKTIEEVDLFEIDSPSTEWNVGFMYRRDAYITNAEKELMKIMKDVIPKLYEIE